MFSGGGQRGIDALDSCAVANPFRALRQSIHADKPKRAQRTPNQEQSC